MGDGTLHVDVERSASWLSATRQTAAQRKEEHVGSPPDYPREAAGQGFADCGDAIRAALTRVHEASTARWGAAHDAMTAAMHDVHALGAQDEAVAGSIDGVSGAEGVAR